MTLIIFQKQNREFGHAKGDEIISLISSTVKNNLREKDIAARYGGDEIAIMLPDTDNNTACDIAKSFNDILAECTVDSVGAIK